MAFKRTKQVSKHMAAIDAAKVFFEEFHEKKQQYYDNKSERWQEGDKGSEMSEDIDSLESIKDDCERLYDSIDSLFDEEEG